MFAATDECTANHSTRPVSYTHLDVYKRQTHTYAYIHSCINSFNCLCWQDSLWLNDTDSVDPLNSTNV